MKVGMKRDIGVADEMTLLVFGSRARGARNCAQSAPKCTYLQFMVLQGKDCYENAHEGGHGHCR